MASHQPVRVGILVFDDVEELDFAGPWEVFGVATRLYPKSFETQLLAKKGELHAVYGLRIAAVTHLKDCGPIDVVVVPGGRGAREVAKDEVVLDWLRNLSRKGTVITSVCTGALVLGAAGLLEGKRATTHWAALDELRAFPKVTVEHARVIDLGSVVTSAGISSGIDMSLHLVARFLDPVRANEVAHRMEYEPRIPLK